MVCAPAPICLADAPAADSGAVDAVRRYVAALQRPDPARAYQLLSPAQQRYFRNARNFASNYVTTAYRVVSYSIARTTMRNPNLAQVDVDQTTSYYDIATARTATVRVTEPYFALRSKGAWGVKEIYEPWKSYAPKATGNAGGLVVVVDRIEFFDRRIQVDCTLRNLGAKPFQVLPLLRSKLTIGGSSAAALNSPDFPLNDRQLFQGARIYPYHQLVGYLNFPVTLPADADQTATLTVGPAVEDGAPSPVMVTIGPINLPKL